MKKIKRETQDHSTRTDAALPHQKSSLAVSRRWKCLLSTAFPHQAECLMTPKTRQQKGRVVSQRCPLSLRDTAIALPLAANLQSLLLYCVSQRAASRCDTTFCCPSMIRCELRVCCMNWSERKNVVLVEEGALEAGCLACTFSRSQV